jgi:hypothetical protein
MPQGLPVIEFSPRFLNKSQMAEIVELWHLSRVKHTGRHDRLILACKWFNDKYPDVRGAYKDLSGLVNWNAF